MRRDFKSEPAQQPKPVTLPTDFDQLIWNAPLVLTLAMMAALLIKAL